jgi:hypothetical protein
LIPHGSRSLAQIGVGLEKSPAQKYIYNYAYMQIYKYNHAPSQAVARRDESLTCEQAPPPYSKAFKQTGQLGRSGLKNGKDIITLWR